MRHGFPILRVISLCLALGVTTSMNSFAQSTSTDSTSDTNTTTSAPSSTTSDTMNDHRTTSEDWGFNPGWIGLVGLLGLMGMMPKDRHAHDRTPATSTTVSREHGR